MGKSVAGAADETDRIKSEQQKTWKKVKKVVDKAKEIWYYKWASS